MSNSQVNFKLGDVVKIKTNTEHYGQDSYFNPADVLGTVVLVKTADEEGYMYDVKWETHCSNVYRLDDLELVSIPQQPTDDLQSELTEALAKIDTLESALEDVVKELISLREGSNPAVIDVKESEVEFTENELQFKPISEMTLEDWELAKKHKWLFADNLGDESLLVKSILNTRIYFVGYAHPFTVDGIHIEQPEKYRITRRVR